MSISQLPTCGIFYCRDSAEINGCGSLQTSSLLDSDVLRNRQQKHTAIRYHPQSRQVNIKYTSVLLFSYIELGLMASEPDGSLRFVSPESLTENGSTVN